MSKTPLYDCHLQQQAKMVDFCGWDLPIHYGSQLKEHQSVRLDAGVFDVSHMTITDIHGPDARAYLRYILSNDVAKLEQHPMGKALYSALLNESGGIIDDLIVYRCANAYRLITNAATLQKVHAWLTLKSQAFNIRLQPRADLAILAVQGPNAIAKVAALKPHLATALCVLKSFASLNDQDWQFARTGYTGEMGLEILLPANEAACFWQALMAIGVSPCGLAARDTLRLEAGLNLYGHDMDESVSPLECNIVFAVDLRDVTRQFIGKDAYLALKASARQRHQIGLSLASGGILREGQKIFDGEKEIGVITSGTFSPSLKYSIALARVQAPVTKPFVEIRGARLAVQTTAIPFINATLKGC